MQRSLPNLVPEDAIKPHLTVSLTLACLGTACDAATGAGPSDAAIADGSTIDAGTDGVSCAGRSCDDGNACTLDWCEEPIGCRSRSLPCGRAAVGAIRWDYWSTILPGEVALQPPAWHARIPFYGDLDVDPIQVRGDSQAVVDAEIELASRAGLDYWAFDYYWPETLPNNYALQLYLSSARKRQLGFCLDAQGGSFGKPANWTSVETRVVELFLEPTYQRVAGGRPLLFMFAIEQFVAKFGGLAPAKASLDSLRARAIAAGAGNPYLVAQAWDASTAAGYVDELGFDAVSAYAMLEAGAATEHPYDELVAANEAYWASCAATGKEVVPIVTSGWDNRPLADVSWYSYTPGPWFPNPTGAQLGEYVGRGLDWVTSNRGPARSATLLIYAWDEFAEGGWLVPTYSEGAAKLDGVRDALGRPRSGAWSFDEASGAIAHDASGFSAEAALHGGASWTTGAKGGAVHLDGSTGTVVVPDGVQLDGMSALTVALFVKIDAFPPPASFAAPIAKGQAFRFVIGSDGLGHFVVQTPDHGWYSPGTVAAWSTPLPRGIWVRLVGTYDGNHVRVYVDGAPAGTAGPLGGPIVTTASDLVLGGSAGPNIVRFQGALDDVLLFARAVTDVEAEGL